MTNAQKKEILLLAATYFEKALRVIAIAKNIGMMNEGDVYPVVVKGAELQSMTDKQLIKVFQNGSLIFSRVSPDDKFRVVDLLMKQGKLSP